MHNYNFPLYSLRAHLEIVESPPYRVVVTPYGKYVLDYIDTSKGTLAERRMELLTMDTGYPLYRLKERCDNIAQVINSPRKRFIDATGRVVSRTHSNRSFHKCHHKKVLHYEVAHNGKYRLYTKEDTFVSSILGSYVEYIEIGGAKILLNVMDSLANKRHRVLV